jgi:uncharacterized SAM-binding protein YcdF (DUF218 family)
MTPQTDWLLTNLAASVLLPPFDLLILGAIGLGLLKRKPKLGKRLIATSLVLLYVFSMPLVADQLMGLLEKNIRPLRLEDASGAGAIVILGGGIYRDAPEYSGRDVAGALTLERLQYGAYLHRETGLPILVTGGNPEGGTPEAMAMLKTLQDEFDVPVKWVEDRSFNTAQNAQFSAAILKTQGIRKVLIVSHAWHLPRARLAFEKAGLVMIAAPTRFGHAPKKRTGIDTIFLFLPQPRALQKSYYAVHEGIGWLWYRLVY